MADVPYHKAADPEVQASGLPGNDRTNHEAMLAYVKASESDDPTDRLPFWGENVVLDDWLVPGEKLVGRDEVLGAAWEGLPGSPLDALTEVRAEIHQTIISGNILVTMGHFTARFVKDVKWSPGDRREGPLELPGRLPLRGRQDRPCPLRQRHPDGRSSAGCLSGRRLSLVATGPNVWATEEIPLRRTIGVSCSTRPRCDATT
jgi:hypothetical protein